MDIIHQVINSLTIFASHRRVQDHTCWLRDRWHHPPFHQIANWQTRKIGRPPQNGQGFALAYSDGSDSLPFVVVACRFLCFPSGRQCAPMYCRAHLLGSGERARAHTEDCMPSQCPGRIEHVGASSHRNANLACDPLRHECCRIFDDAPKHLIVHNCIWDL